MEAEAGLEEQGVTLGMLSIFKLGLRRAFLRVGPGGSDVRLCGILQFGSAGMVPELEGMGIEAGGSGVATAEDRDEETEPGCNWGSGLGL